MAVPRRTFQCLPRSQTRSKIITVARAGGSDALYGEPFKIDGRVMLKKHALTVHMSETSLEEQRGRLKLTAALSMQSMETAHIYAKEALQVEYVRRKHFAGSSASAGIGPVSLTPEDESWKRTVKDKRAIYGKDNRVAPGGARRAWMRRWPRS